MAIVTADSLVTADSSAVTADGRLAIRADAVITCDSSLVTADGSYAFSGSLVTYELIVSSGTFTYAASSSSLLKNRYLAGSTGLYTNTGAASLITRSRLINTTHASFTTQGSTGGLFFHRLLNGAYGSYNQSYPGSVSIARDRQLNPIRGSYSVTGGDATVVQVYDYPPPHLVTKGVVYGPSGQYTGTFVDSSIRIELSEGGLVKPLSTNTALLL